MKKALIFIVFYLFVYCFSFAQQWTTYTTSNGLANNAVTSIIEDNLGNYWMTTWGGISKFNGISWTTFSTTNGLVSNQVNCGALDSLGVFWFGTNNKGVSSFNGIFWHTYNCVDGLSDSFISAIVVDKKNVKWFGGLYNGITSYNDTVFKVYDTTLGFPHFNHNEIRDIVVDKNNVKWFATCNGLLKYNDTSWSWYPNNGLIWAECIALDTMGYIWVGTTLNGVTVYNGNSFYTYTQSSSGLPDDEVTAIGIDKQNNKWFGTNNYGPSIPSGVTKFDGTNWTTFTIANGLIDNYIGNIYCDRFGNLWFSTPSGVSKYNPNVGINEVKSGEIKVYPNPATTKITFINSSLNRGSICIYDAIGQYIVQQVYHSAETTINIESFKKGIYFYTLSDTGSKFYSGKFIKE